MCKTVLITGAAGFIGSNLCSEFLKDYKIIAIDNFLTGKKSNIQKFMINKNFKFMNHDICNKINVNEKIDYIVHLASPASPIDYLKFPIKTLQIGSRGTENLLDLAVNNNSTILLASTSEIYGDPLVHPQSEIYFGNVNPVGPRGVYDEAKRYLEAISMAYKNKYNLDIRIARIFNTYGPKMRKNDGRAIPNFINQCLNNHDITIYGNGKQTRSFCYIDDTILGLKKLLFSDYKEPINIGNPEEFQIIEVAKAIINLTSSSSKITYLDLPPNDPKVRKPDITKAKNLLNWNPKIKLIDGLNKTIDYFSNN